PQSIITLRPRYATSSDACMRCARVRASISPLVPRNLRTMGCDVVGSGRAGGRVAGALSRHADALEQLRVPRVGADRVQQRVDAQLEEQERVAGGVCLLQGNERLLRAAEQREALREHEGGADGEA